MPRIDALPDNEISEESQAFFDLVRPVMGYVPNSFKTMARWPELLSAFSGLTRAMATATISGELRQLVAFMVSNSSGCKYCQAHTSHGAVKAGVTEKKLHAIFTYEESNLFSPAEKAALKVASGAGQSPNSTSDQDFEELNKYFNEREVVEIVSVISLFGFLNRWNDTMATELEQVPKKFATDNLGDLGWEIGKHGA
ncbi:MAG: putative peroxidase-related enzyme [Gammaproteobacteria bacterium]|jgi:uncharacterized peroxidase-related enzyme